MGLKKTFPLISSEDHGRSASSPAVWTHQRRRRGLAMCLWRR